jgi:hypothetical protein
MKKIFASDAKIIEQKKINSVQKVKQFFLWDEVIQLEMKNITKIISL